MKHVNIFITIKLFLLTKFAGKISIQKRMIIGAMNTINIQKIIISNIIISFSIGGLVAE
jgi:hypothetical protein